MSDIRIPTFFRCPPDPPSTNEVKKYRTFLTNLSRWVAVKIANDDTSIVGESVLRADIIKRGELGPYLDADWAKRVFSKTELFEDTGGGFWKVLVSEEEEEAPAKPSPWSGVRPGEDVLGSALTKMVDGFGRLSPQPSIKSKLLDSDEWFLAHQLGVAALEYAKRRGVEKPLAPLQERAFREACLDDDWSMQAAGLWLLNTRAAVESHARLLAKLKGTEGAVVLQEDLVQWGDTPELAFRTTKRLLLERGILSGKKG